MKNDINRIFVISKFISITILRNILGLIRSKIIAVTYGVAEVGLLGQFIAFFGFQVKIVTLGTTASLVNSYNYAKENGWSIHSIYLVNFSLILFANLINMFVVFIFFDMVVTFVYSNFEYRFLLLLGMLLNIIYSYSTFLELILQSQKKFDLLVKGRGLSYIFAILFVVPLTYFYGVKGVVIDLILLFLFSSVFFSIKTCVFCKKIINVSLIKDIFKKNIWTYVIRVAGTDISRSFVVLGSLLVVRSLVLQNLGFEGSGYYQSVISLSYYANLLVEGFIVYYYPVISSISKESLINKEVNINYQILIYLIFPILLIFVFFSEYIIVILFSEDFLRISSYLVPVLIFKIFNIYYYFYSINFLAKNYLKKFLTLEILRSAVLIVTTLIGIRLWQFKGVILSLLFTELFSFLLTLFLIKNISFFKLNKTNIKLTVYSILLLISAAYIPLSYFVKIPGILFVSFLVFDVKKYVNLLKTKLGNTV